MPNTFTSRQFLKVAREFGYPKQLIENHDNLEFMRARARQAKFRSKTWEKFPEYQQKTKALAAAPINKPEPAKIESMYEMANRLLDENHQLKMRVIELEHAERMRELTSKA